MLVYDDVSDTGTWIVCHCLCVHLIKRDVVFMKDPKDALLFSTLI